TWDVLRELTDNTELLAVLCAQWGDVGLPPKQSAFLIQALVAHHYLEGGYYPVGGSWRIADTIIPRIRAGGGDVFTYAAVEEILVEKGVVRGVRMADGHRIDCGCVISSAGVFNTFEKLLPSEVVRKAGYDRLLPRVKRSSAHLGVYVGLKGTAAELGLPRTNIWIYPGSDYEQAIDDHDADIEAPFPVVYLSFPSAKDPDYERRHPGTATVEIVAPTKYEWFARWAGTEWGKRGPEYETFKTQLGERLMAHLYDKLPQLKGRVDYWEVSTPLSTRHFGAWQQGELYGLDHDPARFAEDWLTPRTRITGLWLTGQDVLSCGIAGATMSGVLSATAVAGLRRAGPLLKKILVD
ncbi:MAG: phytoene desaturase family protein, partial [Gammaproteobacteria bacterium]